MTPRLIPTDLLDVDTANVRVVQDSTMELDELARSIADQGVLNPLLVRPVARGRFGVIAGQRRLAASRIAGLELARIRRALDSNVDDVPSFVARALARELAEPSCHARDCHHPVEGAGRFCTRCLQQLHRIRLELERRWRARATVDGKMPRGNVEREIADTAAKRATELLIHGPDPQDGDAPAKLEVAHG